MTKTIAVYCTATFCAGAALWAAAADDTVTLGRKALLREGVTMAWKLSQKALAESPESAVAHEFTAEVLFRRGDFAQSESECQLAASLNPNLALAWWGLARIASCRSLHKTASQHIRRAYELDPRDPRIFGDWVSTLRGRAHIDGLEKYASMLDPNRDADELRGLRQHILLDMALEGRNVMALASPYRRTEIPLSKLLSPDHRLRAYGLDIEVNGKSMRLLVDTGASGIMIGRRAAEGAGIKKLSDATFRGIGNDAKAPAGYHGIADRVRIGDVEFHNALIRVASQNLPNAEDGLIGTDVFADFLVTLDFAAGKLRLNLVPGYQPKDAAEPQDGAIAPEMLGFAHVFRFGHMLLIPTRVSFSREGLFVIDTGSSRTLISYDKAAEAGKINPDDKLLINGINGKVADVYQTGFLFLEFAGFRQRNVSMTAFDMWDQSRNLGTEVSGLLGIQVLGLFTLTIDYRDGLVNFDYQEPGGRPYRAPGEPKP